jgi:hypothetical protein
MWVRQQELWSVCPELSRVAPEGSISIRVVAMRHRSHTGYEYVVPRHIGNRPQWDHKVQQLIHIRLEIFCPVSVHVSC